MAATSPTHKSSSEHGGEQDGPENWPARTEVDCSALETARVKEVVFLRLGTMTRPTSIEE
eukprot:7105905-Prymnesium_polylepis.1